MVGVDPKAQADRLEVVAAKAESARREIIAAIGLLGRVCMGADAGDRLDLLRMAIAVRRCRLNLAVELATLDWAIRVTEAAS